MVSLAGMRRIWNVLWVSSQFAVMSAKENPERHRLVPGRRESGSTRTGYSRIHEGSKGSSLQMTMSSWRCMYASFTRTPSQLHQNEWFVMNVGSSFIWELGEPGLEDLDWFSSRISSAFLRSPWNLTKESYT